jgi:hypothetical protein
VRRHVDAPMPVSPHAASLNEPMFHSAGRAAAEHVGATPSETLRQLGSVSQGVLYGPDNDPDIDLDEAWQLAITDAKDAVRSGGTGARVRWLLLGLRRDPDTLRQWQQPRDSAGVRSGV